MAEAMATDQFIAQFQEKLRREREDPWAGFRMSRAILVPETRCQCRHPEFCSFLQFRWALGGRAGVYCGRYLDPPAKAAVQPELVLPGMEALDG